MKNFLLFIFSFVVVGGMFNAISLAWAEEARAKVEIKSAKVEVKKGEDFDFSIPKNKDDYPKAAKELRNLAKSWKDADKMTAAQAEDADQLALTWMALFGGADQIAQSIQSNPKFTKLSEKEKNQISRAVKIEEYRNHKLIESLGAEGVAHYAHLYFQAEANILEKLVSGKTLDEIIKTPENSKILVKYVAATQGLRALGPTAVPVLDSLRHQCEKLGLKEVAEDFEKLSKDGQSDEVRDYVKKRDDALKDAEKEEDQKQR